MKEQEAKTKWCPFARTALNEWASINRAGTVAIEANRGTDVIEETRCIASGCMAWRWTDLDSDDGFCGLARRT